VFHVTHLLELSTDNCILRSRCSLSFQAQTAVYLGVLYSLLDFLFLSLLPYPHLFSLQIFLLVSWKTCSLHFSVAYYILFCQMRIVLFILGEDIQSLQNAMHDFTANCFPFLVHTYIKQTVFSTMWYVLFTATQ
jgi:hypothetical protein